MSDDLRYVIGMDDKDYKKLDRTWVCIFLIGMMVFIFMGYTVGCSVTNETNEMKISHLEGTLNNLRRDYWRQVTLSEYLAMETFDFKTEMVSAGRGSVLLIDVNRSTYFSYTCLEYGIWSCGLTNYNSTSTDNVYRGGSSSELD